MKFSEIQAAPWNARKITEESVAELARSIDEQGLISPITLWEAGSVSDGKGNMVPQIFCIAGNRRLAALRSLHGKGYDGEVPSDHYIMFDGDEVGARAITITENLQREDIGIVEEAAAVGELIGMNVKIETIAAQLGKSAAWVRRRARLATLDEAWKARAGEMDADALEKIAAYPANIQKAVAKTGGTGYRHWRDIAWAFDRESRDLDAAKWDTKACRACMKRTGVEADLFEVADGKLGRCLDCKCFEAKAKAHIDAKIAKAVGNAEVVMKKYAWEYDYAKAEKKSKANPCAYVMVYHDDVQVTWGPSKAEADKKAKAEEAARKARREAKTKEAAKETAITEKLDAWKDETDDGGYPRGLAGQIVKRLAVDCEGYSADYVTGCVANQVMGWNEAKDWADILRAFPDIAGLAGVTDKEVEYLLGKYAEEE